MSSALPDRPAARSARWALAALVTGAVTLVVLVGQQASPATSTVDAQPDRHPPGTADGVLPEGVGVLDDRYPGVANLDPALREALRGAARAAASDGMELLVNSGWRSPDYQEQLLDEAVATYGSREAAARWVATPATSPHVSGDAVDIGPSGVAEWLADHGADYGLCAIYDNEPWHFELRPDAADRGCPPRYADPTEDPRMGRSR